MVVDADDHIIATHQIPSLPTIPAPGLVEHDAVELAEQCATAAAAALEHSGVPASEIAGVGIAVQRATTVVWDVTTGLPVGPALSWQDLRTLVDCLGYGAQGVRMPPNVMGSKAAHLLRLGVEAGIDPANLRAGALETWIAWKLSGGSVFATDPTNAGVSGLVDPTTFDWDDRALEVTGIPRAALPDIVPTAGVCGEVRIGGHTLPLAALVGDQQASLVGQGGLVPGVTKTTYGTACMTDVNLGGDLRTFEEFSTYPVVVASTAERTWFGLEATVITGGEAVRSLVDLELAASPDEVDALARSVDDSDGVRYVPALIGLGTPYWDYGARSAILGLTLGSGRAQIARAVLEGVAGRVSQCVRAVEADGGVPVTALRVDGGAAASDVLCQAQSDQLGVPVERSAEAEATALGAGILAGIGTGLFDVDHAVGMARVERVFEPQWDEARRDEFRNDFDRAVDAAKAWVPELSGLSF